MVCIIYNATIFVKLTSLLLNNIKLLSMKNLILVFSFFLLSIPLTASHIVGGDFHVQWVSQNTYNLKLRLYRDDVNGLVNMPATVSVSIYEVGTNNLYQSFNLNNTSTSLVSLGDSCYTPDPNIIRIEEGIYELNNVTIANHSGGYYMNYNTCCRNGIITNLSTPTGDGITIFAMIPDPAIGQNSSPDFGIYPPDAYFCINNIKIFNFPVTDADGDSLVYSLVDPLDNGASSGTYPYYTSCVWAGGYSLANICGGAPAMSINSQTGDITSSPSIQGYFVYSVRVEEYRNGVKLGEVRRELQYASLPCMTATPPNITMDDSVSVYVNDEICFDIEVTSTSTDSFYLHIQSLDFDLNSNFVLPSVGSTTSEYENWQDSSGYTMTFNNLGINANMIGPGLAVSGIGIIPLRYCWTPGCNDVNSTYNIDLVALVEDTCGNGIDTLTLNGDPISVIITERTILVDVETPLGYVEPLPNIFTPNGDGENDCFKLRGQNDPCFDIMQITIFNRWGLKVFESNDPLFCWDGSHLDDGPACSTGDYLVIIDGSFGSTYDPVSNVRIPSLVKDEYWIQLIRE